MAASALSGFISGKCMLGRRVEGSGVLLVLVSVVLGGEKRHAMPIVNLKIQHGVRFQQDAQKPIREALHEMFSITLNELDFTGFLIN